MIHKRELADQDLVNIWLYSWQAWGEKQADAYLDDLGRTLQLLLGRERRESSPVFVLIITHIT